MVAMLSCHRLSVAVPGRTLVTGLDLALDSGDFLAVLGQNGSGKTLTLHSLAGLRAVGVGQVCLEGELIASLPRRHVAKKLALLPQSADDAFPATVQETVLIGRHPHVGPFAWESDLDRRIAEQALELVHLANFSVRDIGTLSGGERRRVAIAQVLTQQPNVYLLDEPTNHLDPQHQLEVMRIFRDKALAGAAVVASLHDVNLAVRYASHCLLLYGDGRWNLGPTSSLLDEDRLSDLYATRVEAIRWRDRDIFMASEPAA